MYAIEILRTAQKSLARIAPPDRERIVAAIRLLAREPRPPGSKKLSGRKEWRIRVGTYRVIYEIVDQKLLIVVIEIGHRRDVYR